MKKLVSLLSLLVLFTGMYAQIATSGLNGSTPNIGANLKSINTAEYVVAGNTNITGTIINSGSTAINSFDVTYKINGGPSSAVYTVSGVNIAPSSTYNFTHNIPAKLAIGQHNIETTILNINGNNGLITDVVSKVVTVVSGTATKRVMCEECTGTWCGWCVRGIVYMGQMATSHPGDWIGVAVHNGDPMVVSAWDAGSNAFPGFSGYPSIIVDRTLLDDPSNAATCYATQKAVAAPVDVAIENVSYNSTNKLLTFTVKATSATTATVNWRINGAIYEMDVNQTQDPGADSTGYQQHNYYSGGGSGTMGGFESLPSVIPASYMHYDFVNRAIIGGYAGTSGSIPTSVTDGTTYSKTYTYLVTYTQHEANFHIVGFVVDQATGKILNSIQTSATAGIPETHAVNYKMYPNPTKGIVTIEGLNKKSTITVTNIFGETVKTVENTNVIDLLSYANGIYFIKINTDNHITTEKIILNK